MKLVFDYPSKLEELEILLATKSYETIWQADHQRMIAALKKYTGLEFQQDEIRVIIHTGRSMSRMDGMPMRLSSHNTTTVAKLSALIHELGHRLLFGNGLYGTDSEGEDGNEIRVYLFQGDVMGELYGPEALNYWASTDPSVQSDYHIRLVAPLLKLSPEQRQQKFRSLTDPSKKRV